MTQIREVDAASPAYERVLEAAEVLGQGRYLSRTYPHAERSVVLGAFDADGRPIGFLLALVQIIGVDEGRAPIVADGEPLREWYVEAFGVLDEFRRRGIGRALQEHGLDLARKLGCYQARSRSPVSASENYALKLQMGYAIDPSTDNDSYYFLKKL